MCKFPVKTGSIFIIYEIFNNVNKNKVQLKNYSPDSVIDFNKSTCQEENK